MSFNLDKNKREVNYVEYIKCYYCNKIGHFAWECQNKLSRKIIQELKIKNNNRELEAEFKEILKRRRIPSQFLCKIPQTFNLLKLLKKLNNSKAFDKNLNLENKIECLLNKKDYEFSNKIKEKVEKINPVTTEEKIDLIFNKIVIKGELINNFKEQKKENPVNNEKNFFLDFKNYLEYKEGQCSAEYPSKNNKKEKEIKNQAKENKQDVAVILANKRIKKIEEKQKKKEEARKIKEEFLRKKQEEKNKKLKESGLLASYTKDEMNILNFLKEPEDKKQRYLKIIEKVLLPYELYWEDCEDSNKIREKLKKKTGLDDETINKDKYFVKALYFFNQMKTGINEIIEKNKYEKKWEEEVERSKKIFEEQCALDWLAYIKFNGVIDCRTLANVYKREGEKDNDELKKFYAEKLDQQLRAAVQPNNFLPRDRRINYDDSDSEF